MSKPPKVFEYQRDASCEVYHFAAEDISLEPAFGKDAVAIMLATDDNYAPYASVMIQSIKENASKDRSYDIVVVGSLSENNKRLLVGMAETNIVVRVVDIKPLLKDVDWSIFKTTLHFSVETYYRFFIPMLFRQYEKVLYLDVDVVALRDVAEVFDTEMGDSWWAVARERAIDVLGGTPGTWVRDKFIPYLKETLKMDSVSDYFQAGVMVWNVKQCTEDKVYEQLVVRLKEIGTPRYVDQCVMNSLANGRHIHRLPDRWNVPWCIQWWTSSIETVKYERAMHDLDNPFIIHFCGDAKPWNDPNLLYADKFWQYARRTPYYETMLLNVLLKGENRDQEIKKCKRKVKQYRILQALTFGAVRSFRRRKKHYRDKIRQLATM